jgi:starvation-inducible DNA-binding protein
MDLVKLLRALLGDVVTMYFHSHGSHWNVVGECFPEYHAFYQGVYEDVYGSIDAIAEEIRQLGAPAPQTLGEFLADRTWTDDDNEPRTAGYTHYTALLFRLNNAVLASLDQAIKAAQQQNKQGLLNFLADRQAKHTKWHWQFAAACQ